MYKYTLLLSDEATGKVVEKKVSPIETILIVPKKKLEDAENFSNALKGRTFTHVKMNAVLNRKEVSTFMEAVAPILHTPPEDGK